MMRTDHRSAALILGLAIACLILPIYSTGAKGAFSSQEYFPLHPGSQYRYIVNGTMMETETVANYTVNVNGVPTRPVITSTGDSTYYTNDADGIRFHGMDLSDGSTNVMNPPVKIASSLSNIGQTLTTTGTSTYTFPGFGVFDFIFSATSRIEAVENVSVPLGTFVAVRIKVAIRETGVVSGTPIDVTAINVVWVARYYGPVRVYEFVDSVGAFDSKLVSVFVDTDADGINVTNDNCPAIRNPYQADTDRDGDGDACDTDDDNDGLSDSYEQQLGTDPRDKDTDNDGLDDGWEIDEGLDPLDGICPPYICRSGSWRRIIPLIP